MKQLLPFFVCLVFLFFIPLKNFAAKPDHFREAKKVANQIFAENPITLYCGCRYNPDNKQIDLSSCGMESAASIERANWLEWEHMVPAENFGRQLTCWRENICLKENTGKRYRGRKCCGKSSKEFRQMESELYNLWPAVGLVNGARSNYRYTQFASLFSDKKFYGCPLIIDKSARSVEPRDEVKGIVSRATLFMSQKYDLRLSDAQHKLFEAWNKKYPPSVWEKKWANKVEAMEGYPNPFIKHYPYE